MNFNSPLDNQAARSALVSTGIVGLTAAIMKKVAGASYSIGLPVGVGTALLMDYAVKRNKNHSAIRIMNEAAAAYLRKDEKGHWLSHQFPGRDFAWFSNQLVTAYVSLGSIAGLASWRWIRRRGARVIRDTLAAQHRPLAIMDIVASAASSVGAAASSLPSFGSSHAEDGLPDVPEIRKPQRYLMNSCQFLGVLLISLGALQAPQLSVVRETLYNVFYLPLIDRIEALFEEDAAVMTPGERHEAIEKMMEEAAIEVVDQFETHPERELDLPDVSLVSIVEDENGDQMALSMNRDQAREIPIVHLEENQVAELGNFYDRNPQYAAGVADFFIEEQIRAAALSADAEMAPTTTDGELSTIPEAPVVDDDTSSGDSTGLPPRKRDATEPIPDGWKQYPDGMYSNEAGTRMFREDAFDDLLAFIAGGGS